MEYMYKNKTATYNIVSGCLLGRDDWIRTSDNTPPRRVL